MIYFFSIVLFFMLLDMFITNNKLKDKLFFVMMIIFTFLTCFRSYQVGSDTSMFWADYSKIINLSFSELNQTRYELGFSLMCKFLGYISNNPQILIIFTGLFTNVVITHFICINSKNKLSTGIFYFTTNYYFIFFCLMRQALAICFILLGYNFLKKNKKVLYFFMILLAFSFHKSSIIFLVLPFFKDIKVSKHLPIYVLIISIFTFLFTESMFTIVLKMTNYDKYLTTSFIESSYISSGLYSLSSYMFLLFGLIVPSNEKIMNEYQNDKNYNLLTHIMALGTIISVSSIKISIINRLYLYFGTFAMLWLSNSIELLNNRQNKFIWKFILYVTTLLYVYVITIMDWYGIFPYSFY